VIELSVEVGRMLEVECKVKDWVVLVQIVHRSKGKKEKQEIKSRKRKD
jgi:hypothetical protein